jgi:hypothetical protein
MRINQQFIVVATITLTGANTDFRVIIPRQFASSRYQILSAVATARTGGAGAATLGLFTGAGGTGTTLVTNVALGSLVGADLIQTLTLAAGALNTLVTAGTLFWRVGTAGLNSCDARLVVSEVGP